MYRRNNRRTRSSKTAAHAAGKIGEIKKKKTRHTPGDSACCNMCPRACVHTSDERILYDFIEFYRRPRVQRTSGKRVTPRTLGRRTTATDDKFQTQRPAVAAVAGRTVCENFSRNARYPLGVTTRVNR